MRYIWDLIRNAGFIFYPQTWHNSAAKRIEAWFGSLFWVIVAVVVFVFPAFQLWALCEFRLTPLVRYPFVLIDISAAMILFSMAWGITKYGTHSLADPTNFRDLVHGGWPKEYEKIRSAANFYCSPDIPASQKKSVIQELTSAPYPFKIFATYVIRVVFVVVAFSFYFGLSLLFLGVVPQPHLAGEIAGDGSAIHALGVLRDVQMQILGGTSTEHLPLENSVTTMESAGWEIALLFSGVLYVMLISVLLPMQIGIVGSLDRQLKSRKFWREQLATTWA